MIKICRFKKVGESMGNEDECEYEFFAFMKAVSENASKEWGKAVEFVCPICGGRAMVIRSTYNGHINAKCESCGMSFMQ